MMSHGSIDDVLVVDDDHQIVEFVVSALAEAGYLCCAAYDGHSALLAIESARPALVLLDLHLPGLTGEDVAVTLRQHDLADVPVVLMTADLVAAAELRTTLFSDHLVKPFSLRRLLGCVRQYLDLDEEGAGTSPRTTT
jgi:two-component system, OmpR family, response regulator MtrA